MRIIPTFLPFLLFFTYYYCAFSLLLFYPFTLLPFRLSLYFVSKSYIKIKVERFFFVDGVERRVVVEEIAQARFCIDADVVGNLKL